MIVAIRKRNASMPEPPFQDQFNFMGKNEFGVEKNGHWTGLKANLHEICIAFAWKRVSRDSSENSSAPVRMEPTTTDKHKNGNKFSETLKTYSAEINDERRFER